MLAARVSSLKPSATLFVANKAKEMVASGIDVIDLSTGDPALDAAYITPQSIKDAAIEVINKGQIGYTTSSGILPLREAVKNKIARDNHLSYEATDITIGCGAKQLIFNSLMATVNPGDEVIVISPYWVSYPDMVSLFGGEPIVIKAKMQNGFKITAEQLKRAITSKTKWVIFNSPVNPTGALYEETDWKELATVLMDHPNVMIMSDEIYEYLIYDKSKSYLNIVNVEEALIDRTILINSVAKSHAMTGWRIGYAASKNKDLIKVMNNLQSQSTSNACTISQYAMIAALNDGRVASETILPLLKERCEMALNTFSNIKGFKAFEPDGAFYIFVSIKDLIGKTIGGIKIDSCTTFTTVLLEKAHVATVAGSAFGSDGYFRISLTVPTERIKIALQRIEALINS